MQSPNDNSPIENLAQRVVEGQLSEEEYRDLMQQIKSDPTACDRYVDYLELHAMLRRELGGDAPVARGTGDSVRLDQRATRVAHLPRQQSATPPTRRNPWLWAIGLAATIAITPIVWKWSGVVEVEQPSIKVASRGDSNEPIAFLASATGCDWGGNHSLAGVYGHSFQRGQELVLLEGIAEFRLASGVALSVEGPASLVLNSPSSLTLEHGRLTCYVPWVVTDFSIDAAGTHITACDSELGISLSAADLAVHCFSGQVETAVFGSGGDGPHQPAGASSVTTIHAGQSHTVLLGVSPDKGTWSDADDGLFATRLLMADLLPVTPRYVADTLAQEPFGYWRFESQVGGRVANEVEGGAALQVHGTLRLAGSDTNRVAEFGRPGNDCCLLTPAPIGFDEKQEYSIECWMKPSHRHRGGLVSLIRGIEPNAIRSSHGMLIELQGGRLAGTLSEMNPGSLRFLHRNPPSGRYTEGTSVFSSNEYRVRRWQHVTAVKEESSVKLYLNSNLVAEHPCDEPLASRMHLLVGRVGHSQPVYPFVGQLDELVIYGRAFSAKEVDKRQKAMWENNGRADDPVDEI